MMLNFPGTFSPVMITNSGVISCTANSEIQGRKTVEEAIRQLRQLKINFRNPPVVQVKLGPAAIYLGRGIIIQSLPECIPDSLCAQKTGGKIEGKYNRAGQIISLKSMEDVAMGVNELRQVLGYNPVPTSHVWANLAYLALLRIKIPPVLAAMGRDLDIDGNMDMVGYVSIENVRSEAEAQEAARNIDRTLEEAGLLGPLTPREKLQQSHTEDDPKGFDYFANDPEVWADDRPS
jgi:hypothetical protein